MTRPPLWMTLLACSLLTACAAGPRPMPAAPIKVPPPPNLTTPPPPLPPPASGRMADLEANHRQVARSYHQLASQLCRLLALLEADPPECKAWHRDAAPTTQPETN